MGKDRKPRLVRLQGFLKETDTEIVGGLGLGGGIRTMYRRLSILNAEERALKLSDTWIKEKIVNRTILLKNRFTKETVNIPLGCVVPSLRRPSGISYLDVTEISDFVVEDIFPDMDKFFNDPKTMGDFVRNKTLWKEYISRRLGTVTIARKYDLSAPGTRFLCFFSSASLVPGEFWLIRNLSIESAKIFCLCFNSTPNLAQMFLNRTETRGAWMKTDMRTLKETYIIDPRTLAANEKDELVNTFDRNSRLAFPNITEQLRTMYSPRKEIDKMMLRIIGFGKSEIERMLDRLYLALYREIEKLKTLMKG